MLTPEQQNKVITYLEIKQDPIKSSILIIEELRKTNNLLQMIADKEWPLSFPRLPALPDIKPTDLTEIILLLKQLNDKKDPKISIKII